MNDVAAPRLASVSLADIDAVLALNQSALPAVSEVEAAFFEGMIPASVQFLAAHLDDAGDGLAGFLLLLGPGTDYASLNYQWFSQRYDDFLYVDRIVVAARARRRGVGRAFYDAAWRLASGRGVPLTCEVNVVPPNPESMAFHQAFGFAEVGRQDTEGGAKTVSLLARTHA